MNSVAYFLMKYLMETINAWDESTSGVVDVLLSINFDIIVGQWVLNQVLDLRADTHH